MDLINIRDQLNKGISLSNIKLRVTFYSRVSTDHIEQLSSLRNQKDYFEDMIKSNSNWLYVQGYVDEGISGTTDYKRENFMRMIEDAKNNMFDLIVTKEISRFSRNTLDSIKYTRILLSYGVAVLFLNDNINTIYSDAELRLTIMASMAQDEIRRLSERVKFGMIRAIKNGTILGNNMLYGYKKNKITNNLEIIDEEAMVVKKVFTLYTIDKYSLSKIAKYLNKEGIKTVNNKSWSTTSISRMIKNPKYKGYYCGKKSEVIDYMTKRVRKNDEKEWIFYEDKKKIPPIINKELWNKANERINKRSLLFGKDYKDNKIIYQNRYPLSTKIICANDNCTFYRRKIKNDVSWICSKHLELGKTKCNSPIIREKEIYIIIISSLKELGFNINRVTDLLLKRYKNNNLKERIEQVLKSKIIEDKVIELLLSKIVVNNNKLYIYLKINNNQVYKKSTHFTRDFQVFFF